jgi:hypothetical protein
MSKSLTEETSLAVVQDTALNANRFAAFEPGRLPEITLAVRALRPDGITYLPVIKLAIRLFQGIAGLAGRMRQFNNSRIDEKRLTSRDPYLEAYRIHRIF